eukprot:gene40404-54645_t
MITPRLTRGSDMLKRYGSALGRTGFLALMLFVGGVSFIAGIAFLMMGAWPVFGFFGLDVLAIWWAFRINYRRGGDTEEIATMREPVVHFLHRVDDELAVEPVLSGRPEFDAVGDRRGNPQFDLRAGPGTAPNIQLRIDFMGPFAHAGKPP